MSSLPSDIRKKGYLVKQKTMRRKFYVLREGTPSGGPARLEYYDTEKKFRAGAGPKRSVVLSSCFSIHAETDARHRPTLALFTKDSSFSVVCENEEQQRDWLSAMLELRHQTPAAPPLFDRIWPVTVKAKGVANGRHLQPGPYRLCLTNKSLGLVRVNHEEPDITLQLDSIRRCANKDKFFFMELGRGCKTGEGELWLQVEDDVIALNMHDNILSSMKAINSSSDPSFRGRCHSSADKASKPHPRSRRDPATLPKRSKTLGASDALSSSLRRGSMHSPGRPEADACKSSRVTSGSSPSNKTLSLLVSEGGHRLRTDSMESHASSRGTASSHSADEMDDASASALGMPRSLNPETAADISAYLDMAPPHSRGGLSLPLGPSREENYLEMTASPVVGETLLSVPLPQGPTAPIDAAPPRTNLSRVQDEEDYLEINAAAPPDAYMEMSPGLPDLGSSAYMAPSSSASSALSSSAGSSHNDLEQEASGGSSSYMDMSPSFLSPVQERLAAVDGGYIEMTSPPATSSHHPPPGLLLQRGSPSFRPERVVSYLREEDAADVPPKRAYSVGSRASALEAPSYLDMQGGSEKKSSSTPHLIDKPANAGDDVAEHFMEMNFHRVDDTPRPRTSSTGSSKDFRSRSSSFGPEEVRQRTSSFGCRRDRLSRLASLLRGGGGSQSEQATRDSHRPRTATICQDSFRPRTSSFGAGDMRPRSSSHGNSRLRPHPERRVPRKAAASSVESVSSTGSDYLDMRPVRGGAGSSKASPLVQDSIDEGYMQMDLTPPTTVLIHRPPAKHQTRTSTGSSESLSSSSQGSGRPKEEEQPYVAYAPPSKGGRPSPGREDRKMDPKKTAGGGGSSSSKQKGPEYINLDYSGETNIREPLLEGGSPPSSASACAVPEVPQVKAPPLPPLPKSQRPADPFQLNVSPLLASRGSSASLSAMDPPQLGQELSRSGSSSQLPPPLCQEAAPASSKTSLLSDSEITYAKLDLAPPGRSADDLRGASPRLDGPLQYAEIDFEDDPPK